MELTITDFLYILNMLCRPIVQQYELAQILVTVAKILENTKSLDKIIKDVEIDGIIDAGQVALQVVKKMPECITVIRNGTEIKLSDLTICNKYLNQLEEYYKTKTTINAVSPILISDENLIDDEEEDLDQQLVSE